jgi:predicted nucleotide-binding protein
MKNKSKAAALKRINKTLEKIPELKKLPRSSPEFEKWERNTEVVIENSFGEKSRHVGDFKNISFGLVAFEVGTPKSEWEKAYLRGLESAESILQSMIEEVEEYWEDDVYENSNQQKYESDRENINNSNNNVFIIHGHDNGTKEKVARFITKLGLTPIILHEQPNQGNTIIEKFEENADVAYAIALLTPDDVGAEKNCQKNLNPRARQNVIFEFGYFIGRLGRKRVCGILSGDIEIPSDYSGVLYLKLDPADGWKMDLIKEFKAIGIDVDANLAF